MSPVSPDARPVRKQTPWRMLDEEAVVLDVKKGLLYPLNTVGARVWALCDGARSIDRIVDAIVAEFDAAPDTIRHDVTTFIAELVSAGLVTCDPPAPQGGRA